MNNQINKVDHYVIHVGEFCWHFFDLYHYAGFDHHLVGFASSSSPTRKHLGDRLS